MLHNLSVHNFGLFLEANIRFASGLTVITGSTGSGKSLLFDSIALLLERTTQRSPTPLDDTTPSTITLSVGNHNTTHTQYTRSYSQGSATFLTNGVRCTQKKIRDCLSTHVLLAHHIRDILKEQNHTNFLYPSLASSDQLRQIEEAFSKILLQRQKVASLVKYTETPASSKEFLEHAIQELTQANILEDECLTLESEKSTLMNLGKIQDLTQNIAALNTDNVPISKQMNAIARSLNKASPTLPGETNANIHEAINQVEKGLSILEEECATLSEQLCSDREIDQKISHCNERLALIAALEKKHNMHHSDAAEKLAELQVMLDNHDSLAQELSKERAALASLESQFEKQSQHMHKEMAPATQKWSLDLKNLLTRLDMPDTQIQINYQSLPQSQWGPYGTFSATLCISTNASATFLPPMQILSGGELSRLSLALYTISAQAQNHNTLLFDEIEMGLSPDVCLEMGTVLKSIAQHKQVILISHSPQISSFADKHFKVSKTKNSDTYTSQIHDISAPKERLLELTRMIACSKDSESLAQKIATDLLQNAHNERNF